MSTILEVKNLSVQFSKNEKILHDVSFKIEKGTLTSLIGLNGTGKTTLLKTIVGLIKPTSGEVITHGAKIFYIPQKTDLNTSFPLSVREFCELFGSEGYTKYIDELGMNKFFNSRVSSLSGGEHQRILIAIALSRKPDLLLLDEITAGIDVSGEEQFYELVLKLRHEYGISLIIVSHNIHLVIKNADKVLCLAGHLCCSGKPQEVESEEAFKSIFGKYLKPYIHKHDHIH